MICVGYLQIIFSATQEKLKVAIKLDMSQRYRNDDMALENVETGAEKIPVIEVMKKLEEFV
jgi:hypothetical protein